MYLYILWNFLKSQSKGSKSEKVSIPVKILEKMKLNGNFANVYTPYHGLDYLYTKHEETLAYEKTGLNGLND